MFSITNNVGTSLSIYRGVFGTRQEKGRKIVSRAGARRLGQPSSPGAVSGPSSPDGVSGPSSPDAHYSDILFRRRLRRVSNVLRRNSDGTARKVGEGLRHQEPVVESPLMGAVEVQQGADGTTCFRQICGVLLISRSTGRID
jgi:hypothetical protein